MLRIFHRRRNGQTRGQPGQLVVKAVIVRLHVFESRDALFADQAVQVGIEGLLVFWIVQAQVDHAVSHADKVVSEMAHGAEKTGHFLNVRLDDVRFLTDLHQRVKDVCSNLLEPAMLGIELVTEDQSEGGAVFHGLVSSSDANIMIACWIAI